MRCDFKLKKIVNKDGDITLTVAFYKGDFKDVLNDKGVLVNRYVRDELLGIKEFSLGKVTLLQARDRMKQELAQYQITPIDEQK